MKKLSFIAMFAMTCAMINSANAQPYNWAPAGPGQLINKDFSAVSGRVLTMKVLPAHTASNGAVFPDMMFISTSGGGIWRSKNFKDPAPVWEPLTDFIADAGTVNLLTPSA